jgi:uncharacterized membrane protein HdeD (DUF308 family)
MWLKNWGWTIARGVAAIIFGLLALLMPGATWVVLMSFFAVYALFDGVGSLIEAFSKESPQQRPWWQLALRGLLGVAVAILWFAWPGRASQTFLYVLGTWAIVTGVLEIASAIRLRRIIEHEWRLAFAGLLAIGFGVIAWTRPLAGALAIVWWVGTYAIIFGGLMVALGFRMRRLGGGGSHGALPLDSRLRHQT